VNLKDFKAGYYKQQFQYKDTHEILMEGFEEGGNIPENFASVKIGSAALTSPMRFLFLPSMTMSRN